MKTLAATFLILMVVMVVAQTSRWREGVRNEAARAVEAHEQELAQLRERFEGYWSRYELLEQSLAATSNALAEASAELREERSVNDPLRRQIEALSAARLAQGAEEAALRTRLAAVEEQEAALRTRLAAVEEQEAALRKRLAAAEEQEAALRASLAAAEEQVGQLTGALAQARERLRSEEEHRAGLEARLQSTEEELRSNHAERQRLAQELTESRRSVAQAEAALRELHEQRRRHESPASVPAEASQDAEAGPSDETP